MYPLTRVDGDGQTLDGSKHNYTLTFPAGQLPPVNAFWSLTMYDGKTQLLIENPINRYLINSPMLPGMKTNADGSLTLYIQNKSPGADKEANWLPAPNGPIYLVMRLYWPKTDAAVDPAGGRRDMAAARHQAGLVEPRGGGESAIQARLPAPFAAPKPSPCLQSHNGSAKSEEGSRSHLRLWNGLLNCPPGPYQ